MIGSVSSVGLWIARGIAATSRLDAIDIHRRCLAGAIPNCYHMLPTTQLVRNLAGDIDSDVAAHASVGSEIPADGALRRVGRVRVSLKINPALTVCDTTRIAVHDRSRTGKRACDLIARRIKPCLDGKVLARWRIQRRVPGNNRVRRGIEISCRIATTRDGACHEVNIEVRSIARRA